MTITNNQIPISKQIPNPKFQSPNQKSLSHWLLIIGSCLFLGICFLEFPKFWNSKILAQHFESSSYVIDWGNFNMTAGNKSSTNYKLSDTVGQIAPGLYSNSGLKVKSGFQYIYDSLTNFTFTIDNLNLAYGSLVPGIGSTVSNNITITTPSGAGYQIMAAENHPLQLNSLIKIPDTACDGNACSISSSALWTDAATYGFGFNAIGINNSGVATNIGTSAYFPNNNYYRPFANLAATDSPQTIMSESSAVKAHSARITYKVNISASQSAGDYENGVTFIAVPTY